LVNLSAKRRGENIGKNRKKKKSWPQTLSTKGQNQEKTHSGATRHGKKLSEQRKNQKKPWEQMKLKIKKNKRKAKSRKIQKKPSFCLK